VTCYNVHLIYWMACQETPTITWRNFSNPHCKRHFILFLLPIVIYLLFFVIIIIIFIPLPARFASELIFSTCGKVPRIRGHPFAGPVPSHTNTELCEFAKTITFIESRSLSVNPLNEDEFPVSLKSVIKRYGHSTWYNVRGCVQNFADWPPGARLQMVQLSVTRCSCIAILWVSLVSFLHNPLCFFSTSVCCCKRILFLYRLSPETFGYTLVYT
jgi:hypothetical protein